MRMGYEIALKQVPKLVMTPELRQAITVLQLPLLELRQYVEGQLLENPLLEMADSDEGISEAQGPAEGSGDTAADTPRAEGVPGEQEEKSWDIEWQQYFADSSDIGYQEHLNGHDSSDEVAFENIVSSSVSLTEHLMFQLRLASISHQDIKLGELIIGNIDDDGYLRAGIDEIAAMAGCTPGEVRRVLKIIQTFEPPGVGALNLVECLSLQLQALDLPVPLRDLVERVIKFHLDDLAAGRYGKIADSLGISVREAQHIWSVIRSLDPKPGRQFGGGDRPGYIIPDILVEKVDGDYVVIVNDTGLPRLMLSPTYRRILNSPGANGEAVSDYIKSKLNSALWLIKSIEQRRLTLQKVTECIVKFQVRFFDYGIKYLRPLTLREVADEVGVHESTVSRAASGKYVETPRGTFELKFFFASGVSTAEGEGAASESVKMAIREIIEAEDSSRPMSDQAITDELQRRGVMICRRTVAKYREEMGIPASSRRRRY